MERTKGMNLQEWCKTDPDDQRVIHYELICHYWQGAQVYRFSSEDCISPALMLALQDSNLTKDAQLINNEWYIYAEHFGVM